MAHMRPIGLIALIALIGFSSCSRDDEPDTTEPTGQKAISFGGELMESEAVTRADEPLSNVAQTFMAWSFKNDGYVVATDSYDSYQTVMPGYVVNWAPNSANTTTSNTDNWDYVDQPATLEQTIKYWDWSAYAYRFFGATNWQGEDTGAPYVANKTYGTFTSYGSNGANSAYKVTTSVDATSDANIEAAPYLSELWFSTGNPTDYADKLFGKPVKLRFIKPFARVRFMFSFTEGLSFGRERIKNIKFFPTGAGTTPDATPFIATSGDVTATYPLKGTATKEIWSTTNTQRPAAGTKGYNSNGTAFTIDYYVKPNDIPSGFPVDGQSTSWPNTERQWYYVLPATNQGSYTLQACVVTEEVKTVVVPAEFMQWQPGFQYTYNFKITEKGGITMDIIQVAINDWGNRQSSEHTVYNW